MLKKKMNKITLNILMNNTFAKKITKFINNDLIQDQKLYGKLEEGDLARHHIIDNETLIEGEKELGIQKICVGGMIITTEEIAKTIVDDFNERQHLHIKEKSYTHKILCERKEEAVSLIFLTIYDLVGQYADGSYKDLDRKELCYMVQNNVQAIVEEKLACVINYSKHIVKDYYSVGSNRLKIKLNYILDDGKYDIAEPNEKTKGGLLLNGFLDELLFYSKELAPHMQQHIGVICQVLCPTGLPRNKKWIQIDVGISFIGKRHYNESVVDAMVRKARENIHIEVIPDIYNNPTNKLFYGSVPNTINYEGFEIHVWEILYFDQITKIGEETLFDFCKCQQRNSIINKHKNIIKQLNN